jgi:ATP-binding cassette subfamily F protein 3
MINLEKISKSFGGQSLFQDTGFKLNTKERVGLVGRNGHGKTTLFRIIAGDDEPDTGVVALPKNYRIGYVRQELDFSKETILEEGMTGLPPHEKDQSWKVEKILSGLGFSHQDFNRPPADFSGGFQVRLNLAKVLVSQPDLLLLDEPTNYLDITSIRWIERFLLNWPRELLLITHDRSFMDKVVTHIVGIHRGKMRKIEGDTAKYYTQIAKDEEIYEKTRLNDEKRAKEIKLFISRFRAKARLANMVQSRIKTLSKMEKKEKLEASQNLDFQFRIEPFGGRQVMNITDLTFSYENRQLLIDDFNLAVKPGERVCIIGQNGKGKTTLLKLLAGRLTPRKGIIEYHQAVKLGYFEQTNASTLIAENTVVDEILYSHTDVDRQLARNVCGAMMFGGDDALKRISVLSGGEKSRVLLGKLLVTPHNLLLLDEPTNHLDMESCDALLGALDNFEGALIMVTHNEMFLDALAQRLIVFQNNSISVFNGSYAYFLEKTGWLEEKTEPLKKQVAKKEIKRLRSDFFADRAAVLNPLKKRVHGLENDIAEHETKLAEFNQTMAAASRARDSEKIVSLSQTIHLCQKTIDQLYDELETATEAYESQKAVFAQQLAVLEKDGYR